MVVIKVSTRWNFSYSPSERKTISGVTYYKVAIGKETRWLSMSGIKMLHNAKQAGVNQKTALKGASYYTGQGTRIRIGKMRRRISGELADLMQFSPEDFERLRLGIKNMAALSDNDKLYNEMVKTLSLMTEEELQQFYRENRMLLERFFTDSDKLKGTPATAKDGEVASVNRNINRNAQKVLGKMQQILARRLGQ